MICSLEFGLPRQARQMKDEAKKIEADKHADKGTVRPPSMTYFRRKSETGKKEEIDGLAMLKELQQEYKKAVHTLARYPYSGGFYLAPAPVVAELLKLEQMFEHGAEGAPSKMALTWVKWATEVYPEWEATAKERMGSMYSEDDFPTLHDCKKRFRMHLTILPLAEKEQVARITLISPAHQQLLKAHADNAQQTAIGDLKKQIWKDFMEPLQKVVEVFSKDKFKVYDSLLGNLMTVVNVIPAYKDLFDDANLMNAAEQVKVAFGKMTTDDLRTSDEHRKTALVAAKTLVAQFDPFAREFTAE